MPLEPHTLPAPRSRRLRTRSLLSLSRCRKFFPSLFLRTSSPQPFPFRLNASTRAFKECDFDGRRRWQSKSTASTVTAAGCTTNSEDYIVIGGLEGPDRALRDLTATVHFQIDPAHKVEKAMGPIQARNSFFFHHVRCACVEAKAFLAELQEFHDYVQAVFSMRCASLSNATCKPLSCKMWSPFQREGQTLSLAILRATDFQKTCRQFFDRRAKPIHAMCDFAL